MQTNMIDAMARSNNPVRAARAIREQVEARVVGAREELELQWQNERKKLLDEIERLKTGVSADEKKKAARKRCFRSWEGSEARRRWRQRRPTSGRTSTKAQRRSGTWSVNNFWRMFRDSVSSSSKRGSSSAERACTRSARCRTQTSRSQ